MDTPLIDHCGPEFSTLARRALDGIKTIFRTTNPVVVYTATGTGAWEAALVNTLSPGDHVLMVETGQFAAREASRPRWIFWPTPTPSRRGRRRRRSGRQLVGRNERRRADGAARWRSLYPAAPEPTLFGFPHGPCGSAPVFERSSTV